ncbi:MAG: hypothetical protein Q9187_006954, partial [Circinaria calcarea]
RPVFGIITEQTAQQPQFWRERSDQRRWSQRRHERRRECQRTWTEIKRHRASPAEDCWAGDCASMYRVQACKGQGMCDGERPDPCTRCVSRDLRCVYEPHTKTHKDDLLREIEEIKAEHAGLQEAASLLRKDKDALQAKEDVQSVILDILENNGHNHEIVRRLRHGEPRDSVARWLLAQPDLRKHLRSLPPSHQAILNIVKRVEDLYEADQSPTQVLADTAQQWTQVTKSQTLITHLFELYFTWVHPIHMLFSEVDFLASYRLGDDTYCSIPLTNAICAMACHLLDNPSPEAKPRDKASMSGYEDAQQLRGAFMAEARATLVPEVFTRMTSIQAFAIMFLSELSSGKARSATAYLRCAADHLKFSKADGQSQQALELSHWGVHTLNTAWSGFTYQKPFAPVSPRSRVFLDVQVDRDYGPAQWRYYRQPGDERDVPKRPSFAILTAYSQAKLFRIVHDTITVYCGARGRVTAESVIGCYKRYLDWAEELPWQLRSTDVDTQPLPHILSLQYDSLPPLQVHIFLTLVLIASSIQYHTALTQLFTPLLKCNYFSAEHREEIRIMVLSHAEEALGLLEHSGRLYSHRQNLPLTIFCTLHLGDTLIRYSRRETLQVEKIIYVLSMLQEARPGFPVCGPLQQMFRATAEAYGIKLPSDIDDHVGVMSRYGLDDLLDACTRLEYAQPTEQIVGYISPDIAKKWPEEWEKQIDMPRRQQQDPSARYLEINSLLNAD